MRISYAVAIAAVKDQTNSNLNARHEDDPNDEYCGSHNSIYTNNKQTKHRQLRLLSHKVLSFIAGSCVVKTILGAKKRVDVVMAEKVSDSGSQNVEEENKLPYAYLHCQYVGKKASKQAVSISNNAIYCSMMQC